MIKVSHYDKSLTHLSFQIVRMSLHNSTHTIYQHEQDPYLNPCIQPYVTHGTSHMVSFLHEQTLVD